MLRAATDPSTLKDVAEVRVLYVDTDQMGIVNNVHYLRWFEVGRAEWIRDRGYAYRDVEKSGIMLPLVEAHVRYRVPARYDDLIIVAAAPTRGSAASLTFSYALYRKTDRVLLAEGWTRHACTNLEGKVQRFPPHVLSLLGMDSMKETGRDG